ncbi:hypothetical protein Esti_004591 [Eimeria stiedai]
MDILTDVKAGLSVSHSTQPRADADLHLPVAQQKEKYQRSRKRSADALALAGYLAAVLLLCLALKRYFASRDTEFVKNPPKDVCSFFFHEAVVTDFPSTSDPVEPSSEAPVAKEAFEGSEQSYDFPQIDDPKARRKLSDVLELLEQPVHSAIQSEMLLAYVFLTFHSSEVLRLSAAAIALSRQVAMTMETMVLRVAERANSPSASKSAQAMIAMDDDVSSCKISFVATGQSEQTCV